MQNNPKAFEQKKEHCIAMAEERGSTDKMAKKDFMQSCMQRKVGS
jgi:hypothetical protein